MVWVLPAVLFILGVLHLSGIQAIINGTCNAVSPPKRYDLISIPIWMVIQVIESRWFRYPGLEDSEPTLSSPVSQCYLDFFNLIQWEPENSGIGRRFLIVQCAWDRASVECITGQVGLKRDFIN